MTKNLDPQLPSPSREGPTRPTATTPTIVPITGPTPSPSSPLPGRPLRVLVTGANGYLGGHLVELLTARPDEFELYLMNSHWERLPGPYLPGMPLPGRPTSPGEGPKAITITSDLCDFIERADALVHLGWYSTAGNAHPGLQEQCYTSTRHLMNLVNACATKKCRVLFTSTSSVYGNRGPEVCTELTPLRPNCAYTAAKARSEAEVATLFPWRHCTLRLGSLMGKGAPGYRTKRELVVNAFVLDAYHKGSIEVWNPLSIKPVVHVRDVAWLLYQALVHPTWQGTYNVAVNSFPARHIANYVGRSIGATVTEVADRTGPRSCTLGCDKLWELLAREKLGAYEWRSLPEVVTELANYEPTPNDVNVPWYTPTPPPGSDVAPGPASSSISPTSAVP